MLLRNQRQLYIYGTRRVSLSCLGNIQYPQKSNQVDKEGRKKKHKQNSHNDWSMLGQKPL